jgi:hypothetical protein
MKFTKSDPTHPSAFISTITKREFFAAIAMQGILASRAINEPYAANHAVRCADALIAELNKDHES